VTIADGFARTIPRGHGKVRTLAGAVAQAAAQLNTRPGSISTMKALPIYLKLAQPLTVPGLHGRSDLTFMDLNIGDVLHLTLLGDAVRIWVFDLQDLVGCEAQDEKRDQRSRDKLGN
jgi:hypothetical protein